MGYTVKIEYSDTGKVIEHTLPDWNAVERLCNRIDDGPSATYRILAVEPACGWDMVEELDDNLMEASLTAHAGS